MQTFLPFNSFQLSARCLDPKRLGKQRVEAQQILNALETRNRWSNHPAVLMWKGYEEALILYRNSMILEWIHQGYNNNMELIKINRENLKLPPWIGIWEFHFSHKMNLLRKDYNYYIEYFPGNWTEEDLDTPYWWPTYHDTFKQ